MQWLIDLVIEAIGIPPVYIDRGDPAAWDFTPASFISDNTWRELDLSAIVPENAKAVLFRVLIATNLVGAYLQFRRHGNVNPIAAPNCNTVVALLSHVYNVTVAVDADRKIDYRASADVWHLQHVIILGWWL